MPQVAFKDWLLAASIEDTDILKLDVEALDGTEILEVGYSGESTGHEGIPYVLRFTTEKLEAGNRSRGRAAVRGEPGDSDESAEGDDEHGPTWGDDEETLYTRGWEINALVDEDGMLAVEVERQDNAEIYTVEPFESGIPLATHVVIRLAAEEDTDDDEDEDEEEDEEVEDEIEDYDDLDEYEEVDEYEDLAEDEEDGFDDLFEDDSRY